MAQNYKLRVVGFIRDVSCGLNRTENELIFSFLVSRIWGTLQNPWLICVRSEDSTHVDSTYHREHHEVSAISQLQYTQFAQIRWTEWSFEARVRLIKVYSDSITYPSGITTVASATRFRKKADLGASMHAWNKSLEQCIDKELCRLEKTYEELRLRSRQSR